MSQPTAAQIRTQLESLLPETLDILQQMVNINSFTANPQGVNALGKLTADIFAPLGFQAETVQAEPPAHGKHLILTRPGHSDTRIGLVSHLDTVFPPEEEERNDFRWREVGDRIYGPGTVDIKGGTAMIYQQFVTLQTLAPELFDAVTWVILLNAGEEVGAQDFGPLCLEHLPKARACLVFEGGRVEPPIFNIVIARKGKVDYRLRAYGRAGHAGNSHPNGANAVVQMADVVRQVADLTNYEQDITFNVGVFNGGTVINRVPHFAEIGVEMRAFDLAVFEQGLADMMALNDYVSVRSPVDDFACRVEVEAVRRSDPWPQNEASESLFRIWAETAQSLGWQAEREARAGLSDGNGVWHALPTLDGLGPHGGNAHCSEQSADGSKEQEYVTPASFVPKAQLNVMALLKLLDSENR